MTADLRILTHIISYCDQIDQAVVRFGNDFAVFASDPVYRNAVSLCILQIGELVGNLSDEFKERTPPSWRQIRLCAISWLTVMGLWTIRSPGMWCSRTSRH